jgi:hypothetical protein
MLVSFLQALLSIFQREMENWESPPKRRPRKLSAAAEALAESIEAAVHEDEKQSARTLPAPAKSGAPKRKTSKARRRRR